LGASGAVELIVTIKALENNVVPMTMNLDTPDPDCDLDYTPKESKERTLSTAMSNSFGFGGHNASMLVGKLRDN
jgi:3-oxoacyl-[acyl-carrier-protein] synthase II